MFRNPNPAAYSDAENYGKSAEYRKVLARIRRNRPPPMRISAGFCFPKRFCRRFRRTARCGPFCRTRARTGSLCPPPRCMEPLGLNGTDELGSPSGPTYCVAICPLSASFRIRASGAMNLPSPCETGYRVDIAHPAMREPRRQDTRHPRADVARDVARNVVVRQRRAVGFKLPDFAERHQPELYQCLEAVANAQYQPLAVFEKRHHRVSEGRDCGRPPL